MLIPMLILLTPAHAATAEASETYRYAGPAGESEQTVEGIVAAVLAAPDGRHFVWQPGWPNWKSWEEVPAIQAAVEKAKAPPAPAATPTGTWSYSDGGAPMQLDAAAILQRVQADPSGRHLVWKAGMTDWVPASTLPEFAVTAAPPPPPPVTTPPPPPPVTTAPPPPKPHGGPPPEGGRGGGKGGMGPMRFKAGGEVRTSFAVNDIGVPDEAPAIGLEMNRLRPYVKGELGEHWSTKISLDVKQGSVSVAEDGSVTRPTSWGVVAHDAYVQGAFTTGKLEHALRVGAQETTFGARDYFDKYDGYYVGGHGYKDLPRLFGTMYGEDLGVSWHTGMGDTFGVDLQLTNGEGVESPDSDGALDFMARVEARPVKYVGVWGSFMTGGRETEAGIASLTLADVGLEGRYDADSGLGVRAYGELLIGALGNAEFNYPIFGALGAVALDVPMSGVVDHLGIVGRYAGYDPVKGNELPDGTYSAAGAANLFWDAGEKNIAMTGLQWEMTIPQLVDLPITNDLTLQFAAKF